MEPAGLATALTHSSRPAALTKDPEGPEDKLELFASAKGHSDRHARGWSHGHPSGVVATSPGLPQALAEARERFFVDRDSFLCAMEEVFPRSWLSPTRHVDPLPLPAASKRHKWHCGFTRPACATFSAGAALYHQHSSALLGAGPLATRHALDHRAGSPCGPAGQREAGCGRRHERACKERRSRAGLGGSARMAGFRAASRCRRRALQQTWPGPRAGAHGDVGLCAE